MKQKKILKGADAIGVEVRQDKSLDKLSKVILFPDKLKEANKVVTKMKWSV
jgi:hypothetical protein